MAPRKVLPSKLNELQRGYITAASGFCEDNHEPIPLSDLNIPYQGRSSLTGLVKRGLMEERGFGFYFLTLAGWRVARAIHALMDREREVAAIDAHLSKIEPAP